jgi:hypothetical protein
MLMVVSPLSFYLGNINEIAFDLKDVALPVTGLFICTSIFLFLLLFLFVRKPKVWGILAGLLVGLAFAIWVQSQLLVWNFGQFNGRDIDWSKWKFHMFIGGVLWFLIVSLITTGFYKRIKKFETSVLSAIYLLGVLSVAISFIMAPKSLKIKIDDSDYTNLFNFHPEKNVLIIILDAFQSDYFDLIVNDYPEDISELDGFTFYRNTISRYPSTMGSLPSIMTGAVYKNQQPFPYFISESREKFGLMQAYIDKSYTAYFAGLEGTYPTAMSMQRIVDKLSANKVPPIYEYLDYGIFRALPTFFKIKIYNRGNWFLTSLARRSYPPGDHGTDLRFLELFLDRASVKPISKGSFKILHFCFPHPPLNVNEKLQYDPRLNGEKGYISQSRGAIRLVCEILRTLKNLGIYDNSEIIIMSDHGTWEYLPQNQTESDSVALTVIPTKVQSSSHALLLHKPANSKGKIAINEMPLETTDLSCLLGLSSNNNDCSNFNTAISGGSRQRTFYFYEWVYEDYQREYLPDMTEYIITGNAYKRESYHLGNAYPSPKLKKEMESRSPYKTIKEIKFSADGNGEEEAYLLDGWSWPERTHRWTDGPIAGLLIKLEKIPKRDLLLRLWGDGYFDKRKNEFQKVSVLINGQPITTWTMSRDGIYEAPFEASMVTEGILNITFKLSNPCNPQLPEHAKDPRGFGLLVKKLQIEEKK